MKYGLISIDLGSVNLGNRLIEYAVKTVSGIGSPSMSVSMFKQPSRKDLDNLNTMDFVLVPGSTVLARGRGESYALSCLNQISVPVFCTAASVWSPRHKPYYDMYKYLSDPIGCRDPVTCDECKSTGSGVLFVGCPTSFVPNISIGTTNTVVVGFSRGLVHEQIAFFTKLKKKEKLVAVIQERSELGLAKKIGIPYVLYDNPENVIKLYAESKYVVTGRLHGVLPAMSQKKPVFFFGDKKDSRFSLLTFLNVPVHSLSDKLTLTDHTKYDSGILHTKNVFMEWCGKTVLAVR